MNDVANGAFLLDVLGACQVQLAYCQASNFACEENAAALKHLGEAIFLLQKRNRRKAEGTPGTTQV